MSYRRERTWVFDAPAARVWALMADTVRFNEAAGMKKYVLEELPQPDGSVLRIGRSVVAGYEIEWEELPCEWVKDRNLTQRRHFRKGPFAWFQVGFEIVALAPERCQVTYYFSAEEKTLVGKLLVWTRKMDRGFDLYCRTVEGLGAFAQGRRDHAFDHEPPSLTDGGAERLAAACRRLDGGLYGHGLGERLAARLRTAGEADVERMRPIAVAREWGSDRRETIELFLAAAHDGVLRMSWDLLCPRCRGAKRSAASLDQLARGAHCPSCNIDYDRDFNRNVEVTFQPAATIRAVGAGGFCLAGPVTTPHVVVQQVLAPGETRAVAVDLPEGDYRCRTIDPGSVVDFGHDGDAWPGLSVTDGGAEPAATTDRRLILTNRAGRPRVALIESRAWVQDALTAHMATTMQAFRDLYAEQVLLPDEDVAIDTVTLMFTDLEGSTALYQKIGDGRAYHLVRDHFAFLAEAVRRNDGSLVKTIGDAVMAAFADPGQAVRAALAVQRAVAGFNTAHADTPIRIKMGMHVGACIAVNLNGRLDYFGSTVNLAARLQGESEGGDIVLSQPLATDPAVTRLLAPYRLVPEQASLKGFTDPVPLFRLTAPAIADAIDQSAGER